MRVVIDTNVLISILLKPREGGPVRELFYAFTEGHFTLLLPEWLIDELVTTVCTKPRLSNRISTERLNQFAAL